VVIHCLLLNGLLLNGDELTAIYTRSPGIYWENLGARGVSRPPKSLSAVR
jgi:hypothetical protein